MNYFVYVYTYSNYLICMIFLQNVLNVTQLKTYYFRKIPFVLMNKKKKKIRIRIHF